MNGRVNRNWFAPLRCCPIMTHFALFCSSLAFFLLTLRTCFPSFAWPDRVERHGLQAQPDALRAHVLAGTVPHGAAGDGRTDARLAVVRAHAGRQRGSQGENKGKQT